jgi:putative nucleotidyltransferase-like protein
MAMAASHDTGPPPRVLDGALRKITEALAAELARPSAAAPDWSDFEWRIAAAVTALHGVSPLLARVLRWQVPDAFASFLAAQWMHTRQRHARIEALRREMDERCRKERIVALAMKGAALHELGVYVAGERPMADLDVLVHPTDAARTARLIESLGFYESRSTSRERAFTPLCAGGVGELGEHANNAVKIELHDHVAERLPRRTTDITAILYPAQGRAGLNPYPCRAALMLHMVAHAAGSMVAKALRLMQLVDLARLSALMTGEDWRQMLAMGSREDPLGWAWPPLELTARYLGRVPEHVLAALAERCPAHLLATGRRWRISDVSLSHPWVDAFPGIDWSRSHVERLGYVWSRIRPDAEVRLLRHRVADSEIWAAANAWSGLSQPRRILRWVTSRQVRPMTLHAVLAALGDG